MIKTIALWRKKKLKIGGLKKEKISNCYYLTGHSNFTMINLTCHLFFQEESFQAQSLSYCYMNAPR